MKIKFIKDLDKEEMSDFEKSELYSIINKNWCTTDSYINYNGNYFCGNYIDYSLVIFLKDTFFIAMISFSKGDVLSFYEEPLNIYAIKENSTNLNLAYNFFYKKLSSLKKELNFTKINFYENEKVLSKFLDSSVTTSFNYQMYVDLSQPEELIKMNVRKSFKSLINWGKTNLQLEVINSENPNKRKFDAFHDFHIKISGRKTRRDISWKLQFEAIVKNEAYLLLGYLDGQLVSGAYIAHGTEIAYYGVAVNDRELMSKKLPIGHAVLYNSILYAKKIGLNKFILGDLNYGEDEKVNAILKYKKGFTNTITSKPKFLIEL